MIKGLRKIFTKTEWVLIDTINGKDAKCNGSYATKEHHGKLPCQWFTHNGVVIGADVNTIVIDECTKCEKHENPPSECEIYLDAASQRKACFPLSENKDFNKGGSAKFEFGVSKDMIKSAKDIKIKSSKIRPDARLHSQKPGKAFIFINDNRLADFTVTDFYEPRKEYHPIDIHDPYREREVPLNFLRQDAVLQTVELKVGEKTYWDVDKVSFWIQIYKLNLELMIGVISLIFALSSLYMVFFG